MECHCASSQASPSPLEADFSGTMFPVWRTRAANSKALGTAFAIWQFYDASVKAELFSTALETSAGILLVDPMPLAPEPLQDLTRDARIAGRHGHERQSLPRRERLFEKIRVFRFSRTPQHTPSARSHCPQAVSRRRNFSPEMPVRSRFEAGRAGEIAIYLARDGGTLIVGDALINFEPYGFAFLPEKYCTNEKQMRRSLRRLLDYDFERMLFAHGTPIIAVRAKKARTTSARTAIDTLKWWNASIPSRAFCG